VTDPVTSPSRDRVPDGRAARRTPPAFTPLDEPPCAGQIEQAFGKQAVLSVLWKARLELAHHASGHAARGAGRNIFPIEPCKLPNGLSSRRNGHVLAAKRQVAGNPPLARRLLKACSEEPIHRSTRERVPHDAVGLLLDGRGTVFEYTRIRLAEACQFERCGSR
jgi:hypothetical protein